MNLYTKYKSSTPYDVDYESITLESDREYVLAYVLLDYVAVDENGKVYHVMGCI